MSSSSSSAIEMNHIGGSSSKPTEQENGAREHEEQKGIECVICMSEMRDTLILPCRHFCLCKVCAVNLRVQSNNCPICRIPFLALIQLKLFRRKRRRADHIVASPSAIVVQLNKIDETNETTTAYCMDGAVQSVGATTITGEANRELLVSTGTRPPAPVVRVSTVAKLSDFYDSVSVYEAFNGLLQQSSEQEREMFFAEKRRRSIEAGASAPQRRHKRKAKTSPASQASTTNQPTQFTIPST